MNVRFDRIDTENFRSIKSASINLAGQGTVIVKGINEYEEKATSNGSGKSSIFEAIIFAIFDETSSGEKNVANRIINDGYSVTLYFNIDTDSYVINRQQKNGKATVSFSKDGRDISARNRTDTNKLIVSTFGITKDIFLDSVFLSQGASTNLASLSPTARKERLEILTNTDYTVGLFKDRLKNEQVKYEAECVKVKMEITKLDGKIDALNSKKYELQQKIYEIDAQIKKREALGNIADIEKDITENQECINHLMSELEVLETNIAKQESELETFRQTSDSNQVERDKVNTDISAQRLLCEKISNEIDSIDTSIEHANKEIARLNKEIDKIKNSDTCPTCGRKYDNVNEEHILNAINELKDSIVVEENKIAELNKSKDEKCSLYNTEVSKGKELRAKLDSFNAEVDKFRVELNKMESSRKALLTERQQKQTSIRVFQSTIDDLRGLKERILKIDVGNKAEFETMINNIDTELESINIGRTTLENSYNEQNTNEDIVKNCMQLVTKDFRTYLLKNSIQYLNKLLEIYSVELFSNSKDVITINDDDSKLDIYLGDATYESLSGGEKTRVNIALLLAQKSLANIIGNIRYNIIILDEILGYCDSQAENNVINLITRELDDLESIYMVSHKEIPVGYDSSLVVVKNKDGLSTVRDF